MRCHNEMNIVARIVKFGLVREPSLRSRMLNGGGGGKAVTIASFLPFPSPAKQAMGTRRTSPFLLGTAAV